MPGVRGSLKKLFGGDHSVCNSITENPRRGLRQMSVSKMCAPKAQSLCAQTRENSVFRCEVPVF